MSGKEKEFKADKFRNFSEWYLKVLEKSEIIDDRYDIKGFYVYRPWAMFIVDIIYSIWEKELEKRDHKKVSLPVLIPEDFFEKEKEHIEGFNPEIFWVTEAGNNKLERRLGLRPTSETAFHRMYSLWIRSYKDLPMKCYQSCSVFRYETKMTKPLIRLREFMWIEAHTAHHSEESALKQVKEDIETTRAVYDQLGIPVIFFKRPEWDKFSGAVFSVAADSMLPDGKRFQLPSTHYLSQKFSQAFDVTFEDEDENKKHVHLTSYGPPISRTLAAIISIFGDNKGLRLPFHLTPVQIVIVPILKKGEEEKIMRYCKKINERLNDYRVKIDDSNATPGEKFNLWELKGVPIRVEVGVREASNNELTVARRDGRGRIKLKLEEIYKLKEIGEQVTENLKKEAQEWFNSNIHYAENLEDLKKKVKDGFVKIPFCSRDNEGRKCAEKIKELGEIAGTLYPEDDAPENKKCIVCGKKANVYVYACRSY